MPPKGFNPPKPKGGTKPKAKGGKKRKNGYAMPKIEKQKKGAESKKAKALQALQSRHAKVGSSSNWKSLEAAGHVPRKRRKVEEQDSDGSSDSDSEGAGNGADWIDGVSATDIAQSKSVKLPAKPSAAAAAEPDVVLSPEENEALKAASLQSGTNAAATKHIAMDCEMVGIGRDGIDSYLARCSVVNRYGHVLYDEHVIPKEKVTDYRTWVSGIRPKDVSRKNALPFERVQADVMKLCKGKILVGHALKNDFKALLLAHPRRDIRDTARYKPFRKLMGGRTPGLAKLCKKVLGFEVQTGEHSSVEDAQVPMAIYLKYKAEWEQRLRDQVGGSSDRKKEKELKKARKEAHNAAVAAKRA